MAPPPAIRDGLERVSRLGYVAGDPVAVTAAAGPLEREIEDLCGRLVERFRGQAPSEIAELQPARRLYRAFGIDPTKYRPSSEALLRRVLRGLPLPRISNAVDLCNLLALEFLLPIGLYDEGKIDGAVEFRRGNPGEWYEGIRKDRVGLEGRPVLGDGRGPFGNPTSDSLRTAVDCGTRSLTMVIFGPADVSAAAMTAHVDRARRAIERHLPPGDSETSTAGAVLPGN